MREMSARATIRAGPNALLVAACIACPFVEFGSSTLGAQRPTVVVAKVRSGSYQPLIPVPTQVGGDERGRAVRSRREKPLVARAQVRVRRADRAPGDRSHARSGGQTRLAGRAAHDAVVRRTGDRDHGAPDLRASALSLRRSS